MRKVGRPPWADAALTCEQRAADLKSNKSRCGPRLAAMDLSSDPAVTNDEILLSFLRLHHHHHQLNRPHLIWLTYWRIDCPCRNGRCSRWHHARRLQTPARLVASYDVTHVGVVRDQNAKRQRFGAPSVPGRQAAQRAQPPRAARVVARPSADQPSRPPSPAQPADVSPAARATARLPAHARTRPSAARGASSYTGCCCCRTRLFPVPTRSKNVKPGPFFRLLCFSVLLVLSILLV